MIMWERPKDADHERKQEATESINVGTALLLELPDCIKAAFTCSSKHPNDDISMPNSGLNTGSAPMCSLLGSGFRS